MTTKELTMIIIIIVGVCALLMAIITVIRSYWQASWLKKHGERVTATVSAINKGNFRGAYRYYFAARWQNPRTNQECIFFSRSFQQTPPYQPGDTVSVLIDPKKPVFRYWVDV